VTAKAATAGKPRGRNFCSRWASWRLADACTWARPGSYGTSLCNDPATVTVTTDHPHAGDPQRYCAFHGPLAVKRAATWLGATATLKED
jgi:hypothetical protein